MFHSTYHGKYVEWNKYYKNFIGKNFISNCMILEQLYKINLLKWYSQSKNNIKRFFLYNKYIQKLGFENDLRYRKNKTFCFVHICVISCSFLNQWFVNCQNDIPNYKELLEHAFRFSFKFRDTELAKLCAGDSLF